MSGQPPELREPDLPRTAKVRRRALRTGWTTGSCAAAAAKAATSALVTQQPQHEVEIALPSGRRVVFAVDECTFGPDRAEAVVVKDAGDDPDVTHGAHLTATVRWRDRPGIELEGGVGVGVVTKPGLGLEVGGPAINPVPREMITQSVREALAPARGLQVVISVPEGERMARKTTNGRLGILGGISILGTTGIVRPFSTASWRASVEQAIAVLAAQGGSTVVLCTGGRTERGAMSLLPDLPEISFVEVGDFTGAALRQAARQGSISRVIFAGMAGKLSKLAGGVLMTHYTRSRVPTGLLASVTRAAGGSEALAAEVEGANTARHAAEMWEEAGLARAAGTELCRRTAEVLARFCADLEPPFAPRIEVIMLDFSGRTLIAAHPERAQ